MTASQRVKSDYPNLKRIIARKPASFLSGLLIYESAVNWVLIEERK
jgi:hypothetical protein